MRMQGFPGKGNGTGKVAAGKEVRWIDSRKEHAGLSVLELSPHTHTPTLFLQPLVALLGKRAIIYLTH